ncbi:MAG TPA: N-glycosylase, partial [Thermoplasmatales archaeon]|nr:N-glycosylase [Thermoplasmatales archaeon]
MIRLVEELLRLRESGVKSVVDDRLKEFKRIGRGSDEEVFKELCFCILTANFNAERSIRIQKVIGDGFLTFSKEMLAEKLRELGHRYPTARAEYIFDARKY